MRTFLIAFALAFFFGIGLTWLIRNLAIRWKLYDEPEGRKIHSEPVPRLGGIAVAIAFAIPILALTLWDNDISTALFSERGLLISLLCGGGLILAVGAGHVIAWLNGALRGLNVPTPDSLALLAGAPLWVQFIVFFLLKASNQAE